jgi:ATPase subunit of ABC transporter with duplicated ATPase domains
LDEITNNLDLETRDHVVDVLRAYPTAMIAVSHDEDFLNEIMIENRMRIQTCLLCKT